VSLGGYGVRYCSKLRLRGCGISGEDWLDGRRSGAVLCSVRVFSRYLRTELFK